MSEPRSSYATSGTVPEVPTMTYKTLIIGSQPNESRGMLYDKMIVTEPALKL
jgi:hypothetical protein